MSCELVPSGTRAYTSLKVTFTAFPDPSSVIFNPSSIILSNPPLTRYNFTILAIKQGSTTIQPILGGVDSILFYLPAGIPVKAASGISLIILLNM